MAAPLQDTCVSLEPPETTWGSVSRLRTLPHKDGQGETWTWDHGSCHIMKLRRSTNSIDELFWTPPPRYIINMSLPNLSSRLVDEIEIFAKVDVSEPSENQNCQRSAPPRPIPSMQLNVFGGNIVIRLITMGFGTCRSIDWSEANMILTQGKWNKPLPFRC